MISSARTWNESYLTISLTKLLLFYTKIRIILWLLHQKIHNVSVARSVLSLIESDTEIFCSIWFCRWHLLYCIICSAESWRRLLLHGFVSFHSMIRKKTSSVLQNPEASLHIMVWNMNSTELHCMLYRLMKSSLLIWFVRRHLVNCIVYRAVSRIIHLQYGLDGDLFC